MPSAPNPRTSGTRAFTWGMRRQVALFVLSPPVRVEHRHQSIDEKKPPNTMC